MKTLRSAFHIALALALVSCGVVVASAQEGAPAEAHYDPAKLVTPPLRAIPPVHPERLVLPNGVVVFLLEDHVLPTVSGIAYVRTTPLWIPNDRVGLGSITGEVMRSGGSTAHTGDWLDDRLAAIGASIGSAVTLDLANASFDCLSDNTSEVVRLWGEVMRQPAFPEDKIELAKVGLRRAIASRNDEMIPLLVRVANKAVYGKDSPYARDVEYATVEAVKRDECIQLHREVFEPSRMVVAVHGDFRSADMKKLLTATLGAWKGAGVPLPALPPSPTGGTPRLVFAPKDDVTQSGIIVANIGFRSDDPDYPAMDVFQTALGGGFQSRLVNRIRSQRGLAYATGAAAGEGYQRPGVFIAYSLTKSESTMVALDLLREEVKRATEAPFTDSELRNAKESVQNLFVFNFEKPSDVLFRAAYYEAIGYPQDFLQTYQQALARVDAAGMLAAAKRKVHPDQMVAIVVGKEKDFDRALTTAGLPVERMDITIPPPPSKLAVGEATPEALTQGAAWLKHAAELAGGTAAWAAIKTFGLEQEGTITIQGQTMAISSSTTWALPDRRIQVQKLPMGEMTQGFDGTNGWVAMMGQTQDNPAAATQMKEQYERSLFHVFGHPDEIRLQALPEPQTVDGVAYHVAAAKSAVLRDWTLSFAPDGSLARMEFVANGPQGPVHQTEVYGDWKPVGSVKLPHAVHVLVDGKPLMDATVKTATLNPTLAETAFKKPAK